MRARWMWLAAAALLLVRGNVFAQDAKTLEELKRLHDKLVQPGRTAPVAEAQQAQEQIRKWELNAGTLQPEARGQLLRLQVYVALAFGDAGAAAKLLPELQREFSGTRETLHAAWSVAGATGDGQLAHQTLDKLRELGLAKEKSLETRLTRLRMVGRPAPEAEVPTESGGGVPLAKRNGVVLVIDFWSMKDKPDNKQVSALRELARSHGEELKVAFVGVNTDAADQTEAARKFAAESGYTWPQHYEQTAAGPLSKSFQVEGAPWQVLIDGEGNIRAVGSVAEPDFQYALRAAIAEAKGEYAAILPKTADGKTAAPKPAANTEGGEAKQDGEKKNKEQVKPEPEPPHDPEAARLLEQARLYLKTGKKTEAKKLLQELIESTRTPGRPARPSDWG